MYLSERNNFLPGNKIITEINNNEVEGIIKTKLREYDEQFVYNLMNVVESSVPLNNLPNGYTGYQINTDYSINYRIDRLKLYNILSHQYKIFVLL